MISENHARKIADQLINSDLLGQGEMDSFLREGEMRPIAPDGSSRYFFRVMFKERSLCVGVLPAQQDDVSMAEARAANTIGCHLHTKKLLIPQILGFDEETGLLLFEDCGDVRLHDLLLESRDEHHFNEIITTYYPAIIRQLVLLQIKGVEGFNTDWCYDTPRFDQQLMVKRESNYFLNEFCHDLLGLKVISAINEEFQAIAENAAKGGDDFFLHRDFQCRNIMVVGSSIRIIDFQGGRLGPTGYDLASLLIDPYAALSQEKREELLTLYIQEYSLFCETDAGVFRKQFGYLQLQRNMQILGAYSFLWKKRGKPFFKEFIEPSLLLLHRTLGEREYKDYPVLRKTVEIALKYHERFR